MLVGDADKTVRDRAFQAFVAKSVLAGIPLFLALPGPRGSLPAKIMLNTDEIHAAALRRSAVQLGGQLEIMLDRLRRHDFVFPAFSHAGRDMNGLSE